MKYSIYYLLVVLVVLGCDKEIKYNPGDYLALSQTHVNFESNAGEKTVEVKNTNGPVDATFASNENEWCTIEIGNNKINIKVEENILFSSRIAKIIIRSGSEEIGLIVRQQRKNFDKIPVVENLELIAGPGEISLQWDEPEEDNFSHVIITYTIDDIPYEIILDSGTTEITIDDLMHSNGLHTFYIQSVDKDRELGEIIEISGVPEKLIAFRFEKAVGVQWIPYYLRESDLHTIKVKIGSPEFDEGVETTISFEIDPNLLDSYDELHSSDFELFPEKEFPVLDDFIHRGASSYEDVQFD